MKNKKKTRAENILFRTSTIIILAFSILAFMLFQRSGAGSLLFGNEAYYHLMVAHNIHSDPSIIFSNLYLRDYLMTPFHAILAIYPKPILAQTLSSLFALACAALFYRISKKIIGDDSKYAMILLVSSTMFIYFMLFVNADSLAVLLTLIAISLYLNERKAWLAFSLLLLAVFPPFNLLFLLGLFIIHREKTINQRMAGRYILVFLMLSLFIHPQIFYQYEPGKVFSDFGSYAGLSLIMVLFGVAGVFLNWNESKWSALFFLAIFIGSYQYSNLNIYVNFYLAFMGGIALSILFKYRWADKSIKNLMYLVLFSSVLFSTLSYMNFAKDSTPQKAVFDSLLVLSESTIADENQGKVISLQDKSMLISYFGLDPFIPVFGEVNEVNISKELLYSRNLDKTRMLLETNRISYILVDSDLVLLVGENEGILFLLRNDAFKKIYDVGGVAVWKYNRLFELTIP